MATILPVIRDFGVDPDRLIDVVESSLEPPAVQPPTPLGVDIAMEPGGEQLVLDRSNDLVLTTERDALAQWLRNAIITNRGVEQSLPPEFGSTLASIVGVTVADLSEVEEPIATAVESTILYHDRVSQVTNLTVDFVDTDRVGFSADVVLDDDATLSLAGGATIG